LRKSTVRAAAEARKRAASRTPWHLGLLFFVLRCFAGAALFSIIVQMWPMFRGQITTRGMWWFAVILGGVLLGTAWTVVPSLMPGGRRAREN
jgi:hypothetical protein